MSLLAMQTEAMRTVQAVQLAGLAFQAQIAGPGLVSLELAMNYSPHHDVTGLVHPDSDGGRGWGVSRAAVRREPAL
jgi:hypothetical protein